MWERLGEREGAPPPQLRGRPLSLAKVVGAVRSFVEMGSRGSRVLDGDARQPGGGLTPQQATEMWQPLAVELRREGLLAVVHTLLALLAGGTLVESGANQKRALPNQNRALTNQSRGLPNQSRAFSNLTRALPKQTRALPNQARAFSRVRSSRRHASQSNFSIKHGRF